ncbi:MAG: L-histidine N(alpha)-methyltransferase, partial [Chloroflexi bacterium]|nr:L-histidine N(alpha)-methyltransferase [Chloroflexota bacterium]
MDQALERQAGPRSTDNPVPSGGRPDEPMPGLFAGTPGPPHSSRLTFYQCPSAVSGESFAQSVERGLSASPRWLSCSWFYDERGSALFEQICTLDEYYLTRAEDSILYDRADEIAAGWSLDVTLVELGSGSSTKTRTLIRAFHDRQETVEYCPIDIAAGVLKASALSLLEEFPRLQVRATAADYLEGLGRIESETQSPRLILFLGSTIGNFTMAQAGDFLTQVRRAMQS